MDHEIAQRVQAAKNGDVESMAFLFKFYHPQLYTHALRIVGNPVAKDVVQDTFLTACIQMASLREISAFYPWLKRILFNNCYQVLRKERASINYLSSVHKDLVVEETIQKQFDISASNQQLYDALSSLSIELRSCVLLRYFSHFETYDEIAKIMGIPIGTVRSRLSAAREKLYAVFSYYDDTSDKVLTEAKSWSAFYLHVWSDFYNDPLSRNAFLTHLNKDLQLRYTSGESGVGRIVLEKEFNNDLLYGSQFNLKNVSSCGNISVLEGYNTNSVEYPDRCAPSTVVVLFRSENKKVFACNVFDSPRRI